MKKNHSKIVCIKLVHLPYLKDSLSKVGVYCIVFRGPDRILAHRLTTMTEVSWLCSLQANASMVD